MLGRQLQDVWQPLDLLLPLGQVLRLVAAQAQVPQVLPGRQGRQGQQLAAPAYTVHVACERQAHEPAEGCQLLQDLSQRLAAAVPFLGPAQVQRLEIGEGDQLVEG